MTLSKGNPDQELLAVLVLSFNKREHTLRCLESVRRLRYHPRTIIVVDNASSDGSAEAIASAHAEVCLLRSSVNRGAAGGRNLGIRWANEHLPYAYLLFLDDDTVVDEGLAAAMIERMRSDAGAGLVTPKAYRTGAGDVLASAGGMRVRLGRGSISDIGAGELDTGQFAAIAAVDSCVGFAVLARREALDRCGGFDDRYNPYGWEEVDLSLRIREAGYTIRYEPRAVCWHAGGTPGRGRRILAYERGKIANYFRLMRRHATLGEWCSFMAVAPLRAVRLLAAQLTSLAKSKV
ncbi:MAG: glycosyltransferase family 2 protein [Gemmatimonadales bacterium]